jgi:hypothetical protein
MYWQSRIFAYILDMIIDSVELIGDEIALVYVDDMSIVSLFVEAELSIETM